MTQWKGAGMNSTLYWSMPWVVKQQWRAHSSPLQPIIKKGFMEACKSVLSLGGLHNKNRSQIKAPRSRTVGGLPRSCGDVPFPPLVARPQSGHFYVADSFMKDKNTDSYMAWNRPQKPSERMNNSQAGWDHRITGRRRINICHLYLEGTH